MRIAPRGERDLNEISRAVVRMIFDYTTIAIISAGVGVVIGALLRERKKRFIFRVMTQGVELALQLITLQKFAEAERVLEDLNEMLKDTAVHVGSRRDRGTH
jgi:hypothetical protein